MTTLPIVNLPLPTVGADDDAWGTLINAILTAFDSRFGHGVSAYNSATQALVSGDPAAQVVYNTEIYDSGGYFASNVFTPLVAGKYRIAASAIVSGTTVTSVIFALYKNGSVVRRLSQFEGSTLLVAVNGSEIVDFNGSTDNVEIKIEVIGTGSLIVQNGVQRGSFSAEFVRP